VPDGEGFAFTSLASSYPPKSPSRLDTVPRAGVLASGGDDRRICIWDLNRTGGGEAASQRPPQLMFLHSGHRGGVSGTLFRVTACLSYSPSVSHPPPAARHRSCEVIEGAVENAALVRARVGRETAQGAACSTHDSLHLQKVSKSVRQHAGGGQRRPGSAPLHRHTGAASSSEVWQKRVGASQPQRLPQGIHPCPVARAAARLPSARSRAIKGHSCNIHSC